jgi:Terminase RNaseH-like domain/Hint domain
VVVGQLLVHPDGTGYPVVAVEEDGAAPTYDLTVQDAHEYYASGILVHNCDEFASFPGMTGSDGATAFDNLRLGLRLPVMGDQPRMILTTTPRRTKPMFEILEQAKDPDFGIVITRGTTYENLGNLADSFRATIIGLYEGTRLGQQELMGEMLADIEGALFRQEWFDASRVEVLPHGRMYAVVGVDPSVAERPGDECGIVVVKATMEKDFYRRHVYVVEDASVKGPPSVWAARVARMARKWDAPIVAEGNQGGELVRMAIAQADSNLPVHIVHATAGKATRAEPIAAASEQLRIHFVGWHTELESQATNWVPSESRFSPDRVDACVAKGTRIATPAGAVPVENVRVGDSVLTRNGPREILWAGMTGQSQDVYEVVTEAGSFMATEDHKVWADGEWQRVDALVCGMFTLCLSDAKNSNGTDGFGSGTQTRSSGRTVSTGNHPINTARIFTSKFGRRPTVAPFPADYMSITSMGTRSTMIPTTLSPSPLASITRRIGNWVTRHLGTIQNISLERGNSPRYGTPVQKDSLGTASTVSGHGRDGSVFPRVPVQGAGWSSNLTMTTPYGVPAPVGGNTMNIATKKKPHANSAESPSFDTPNESGNRSIVPVDAVSLHGPSTSMIRNAVGAGSISSPTGPRQDSVLRVAPAVRTAKIVAIRYHGKTDVYDLTVDADHEFFADGHLVHNCVWAALSVLTRQKGVSFALGRHLRARSARGRLPTVNAALFSGGNRPGGGGRRR